VERLLSVSAAKLESVNQWSLTFLDLQNSPYIHSTKSLSLVLRDSVLLIWQRRVLVGLANKFASQETVYEISSLVTTDDCSPVEIKITDY
jgi:hypothetical protein